MVFDFRKLFIIYFYIFLKIPHWINLLFYMFFLTHPTQVQHIMKHILTMHWFFGFAYWHWPKRQVISGKLLLLLYLLLEEESEERTIDKQTKKFNQEVVLLKDSKPKKDTQEKNVAAGKDCTYTNKEKRNIRIWKTGHQRSVRLS